MPTFMVKKNPSFEEHNAATDKDYRDAPQEGVGTSKSQAEPISMDKKIRCGEVVHSDPVLQRAS